MQNNITIECQEINKKKEKLSFWNALCNSPQRNTIEHFKFQTQKTNKIKLIDTISNNKKSAFQCKLFATTSSIF